MEQYQVTLICGNGKYKPVSCIIKRENKIDLSDTKAKKQLVAEGAKKICQVRGWVSADLKKFGYTSAKTREYDKEKIAAAAKENYERIKEEKYASGEWKRPKGETS